jgi:hypothetical protein
MRIFFKVQTRVLSYLKKNFRNLFYIGMGTKFSKIFVYSKFAEINVNQYILQYMLVLRFRMALCVGFRSKTVLTVGYCLPLIMSR